MNAQDTGYSTFWNSPLGPLKITVDENGALIALSFEDMPNGLPGEPAQAGPVIQQLEEYFARARKRFELDIALQGTPFQLEVWNVLLGIPYGETRTYTQIAKAIGKPDTVRAVGTANGANPIAIIVPCHRVIGSGGDLVGYAGGLDKKTKLLELECCLTPALF